MKTGVSKRGVYYEKDLSPYVWVSPYGDIFKFRSAKKLEIYTRDIIKEIEKFNKYLNNSGLNLIIEPEILTYLNRSIYKAFYKKIEG